GDLTFGDVVRVGSVDMKLCEERPERPLTHAEILLPEGQEVELKPATEEIRVQKHPIFVPTFTVPNPSAPKPAPPPKPQPPRAKQPKQVVHDVSDEVEIVDSTGSLPVLDTKAARGWDNTSFSTRLLARFGFVAVRPGEQKLTRSPLVLTLGGGTLALLLAALT